MADKVFLKKIYDQYLNDDYTYGASNLNPKREISLENFNESKDISKKIEEEVKRQYELLKEEAANILKFSLPVDKKDTISDIDKIGSLTGESSYRPGIEKPFLVYPVLDENNPIITEIDTLILKLSPYLNITTQEAITPGAIPQEGKPSSPNPNIQEINFPNLLCKDCEGKELEDIIKSSLKKSSLKPIIPDSLTDLSNIDGENTKCKNPGCKKPKGYIFNSSEISFMTQHYGFCKECVEDHENFMHCGVCGGIFPPAPICPYCKSDPSKDSQVDDGKEIEVPEGISCVIMELGILKVILIIVRIIGIVSKIVSTIMLIMVPVIKVVTRCAGCWVDPPSAGEAIQLVMEKLTAVIIGIVAEILQLLWNMLRLDCLDPMTLDLKGQVLSALAGISNLKSTLGGMQETFSTISDTYKKEWEDMLTSIENVGKGIKSGWSDAGNQMKNALKENNPYEHAKKIKDNIKKDVLAEVSSMKDVMISSF